MDYEGSLIRSDNKLNILQRIEHLANTLTSSLAINRESQLTKHETRSIPNEDVAQQKIYHFKVKYLGQKVVEFPKGMSVCEAVISELYLKNRKPRKMALRISNDSIRVTDKLLKSLIIDQAIEKISYCCPDRHRKNGFAYICRDCVCKTWNCHAFLTAKCQAPRLNYIIGMAFQHCYEQKQVRKHLEEIKTLQKQCNELLCITNSPPGDYQKPVEDGFLYHLS
ncbi:hypothetical protein GJ496_003520 [Pomphorhynchus laevis]|nr:hypothetical protein GJ496_003520 [Pomphorhynchus laevis]